MNPLNEPAPESAPIPIIVSIMVAVLIWGLLLALGTFLFGGNHPVLRAAIVGGCTLAFLGLWLAALVLRQRRLKS